MNSLENFLEKEVKIQKQNNKTISLYQAIKKYCPNTIKKIKIKIHGKTIFTNETSTNNWYLVILNYLTKKEIINFDKRDNGTFHEANHEYTKYFNKTQSSLYNYDNLKNHFELKQETIIEFLIKAELLTKDKKEIFSNNVTKEKNSKYQKLNKVISIVLFTWSILQFVLLIPKYGYINIIPFFLNSIVFTISIILFLKFDND